MLRRHGRRACPYAGPVARDLDVLGVIAAGGVVGSLARFGVSEAWPRSGTGFPWATFTVNVTGCLLIGVLLWVVLEVGVTGRYARPFLAVGVLGGFTTFSTYSMETADLLRDGAVAVAAGYALASLVAGLLAVRVGRELAMAVGAAATRRGREH